MEINVITIVKYFIHMCEKINCNLFSEKRDDLNGRKNIIKLERNEKTDVQRNEAFELPMFSTGVRSALADGKSGEVWSQMIDELLMFYSRRYPERLKSSEDYQVVGRLMHAAYPTIGRFETHPWVSLHPTWKK